MDQLLGIQTDERGQRHNHSADYYQHEVTPYWMLEALFEEYKLKPTDEFVDFGCGQGRILFYVHYHFQVAVTGIEMNESLYEKTLENKTDYVKKQKETTAVDSIQVNHCLAEDYEVQLTENRFYFFNPFSVQIFTKVAENILRSYKQKKREMDIILYYPTSEYVNELETNTPFKQIQEVKIPGLYNINHRERFLIFRLEV